MGIFGLVYSAFGSFEMRWLAGSLLLNLEAPFTVLLALLIFREHLGRDAVISAALILGGAVVLNLDPGPFGAARQEYCCWQLHVHAGRWITT
jgi:drug/metabolite transporter (DMT)-like permease